jgi:serine/threonine protein kinase
VFDIGQFNHCVYVAMEYVDGHSLRQWSTAAQRSDHERLGAMLDAGRGLAHAHAAGVVHRDFKPDNVLIGNDGRVKVTDFGLARVLGQPLDGGGPVVGCGCGPDARQIADGAVVGTPRYMAPEQLDGAPGDERSDQFSFAASTWELLYGEAPFRAATVRELRGAIEAAAIVAPAANAAPAAAAALRRALQLAPEARYPQLGDLVEELAAAPI